jgi:hypothetical protein
VTTGNIANKKTTEAYIAAAQAVEEAKFKAEALVILRKQ